MSFARRRIRAPKVWAVVAGLVVSCGGAVAVGSPAAAAGTTSDGTVTATTVAGRCTQYEDLLRTHAPAGGWDVLMMSSFMSRESSCNPAARSARDTGLLQINDINHPYLRTMLNEWVGRWSLTDPAQNIRAAAALCNFWQLRGESCYFPWKLDLLRAPGGTAAAAATSTAAATATATAASGASAPAASPASPTASASPKPAASPTTKVATAGAKAATPPAAAAASPATPASTPASNAASTPASARCVQYEGLLTANAPAGGWDVPRISHLMFVTSGCNPSKRWATATGLLRISDVNQRWLRTILGRTVDRALLTDPVQNIRAAAALCRAAVAQGRSCYRPWEG